MKRLIVLLSLACMGLSSPMHATCVTLTTPHTQMVLDATEGNELKMLYYGDRSATAEDIRSQQAIGSGLQAAALPAFGDIDMIHLPAIQVQHASGDLNLNLRVQRTERKDENRYALVCVTLADKVQPLTVRVYYKAWHDVDIIETWTEIEHTEKGAVILKRFDSGYLYLGEGDNVWLTHLHGDWAAEAVVAHEPLTRGVKIIRNTDGARNTHLDAPEVMLSLDGAPKENSGRTIGAALCWNGNFEIRLNSPNNGGIHLYAGIDPQSSEYVLPPKKVFKTPNLAFTYSTSGIGGVSRAFHRWARTCGYLHNGNAVRDILLNSWEGIYFDITEQRIIDMMDDIAAFGGELFVMDDGWFGSKYPRNNDSSSLGDWVVDTRKLPGGLQALTEAAKQRHIKFGIWIEPEAVNTISELYEQHPDWALQVPGRELKLGRGGTQLVLDMTNPKVQDLVFQLVDDLLTKNPEIAYIKWDANASIQNLGRVESRKSKVESPVSNLYIDYHLGLIKVLERIRAKYPNIVIQNCASGGGRANYGLMPYFDEFWVSDNNDALQRVYIQWGTSYFFPSNAMAQHIGGSPYQMTNRVIPIKFRCDVAMSGRLGIELQPKHMSNEERLQCTVALADYKALRHIIQLGNLYRLIAPQSYQPSAVGSQSAPAKQDVAALMYVTDNRAEAVLFAYSLSNFMKQAPQRIRFAGLDPDRTYTIEEKNIRVRYNHSTNAWDKGEPCSLHGKQFTGAYLMSVGLILPLSTEYTQDFQSRIFHLK
ncbi:MAG: alpha-galactosidase [Paludibacteraceae bacterium]|nr:alpha-galactosidase [Paludibacteraceae bacterium]